MIITIALTDPSNIYDFKPRTINGGTADLSAYKGKKILIVNTASECGSTPQYAELQKLHTMYGDKVVVIGFPANNFGGQEPGTDSQIASFCRDNYQVTFPMMSKISVKGEDIDPLFRWLTTQPNPDKTGDIRWNFEKFLIDEKGKLIRRFHDKVSPLDESIIDAVEMR